MSCSLRFAVASSLALAVSLGFADAPRSKPLFDMSGYRPAIVLKDLQLTTDKAFVEIRGMVFTHAPVTSISVNERKATFRNATPQDLEQLGELPRNLAEAPIKLVFDVPDAGLPDLGANDFEIRALDSAGRTSDVHRVTVLRTTGTRPATESSQLDGDSSPAPRRASRLATRVPDVREGARRRIQA